MITSTEIPGWGFPVLSAVLIYLLFIAWVRKDEFSRLERNFGVTADAMAKNQLDEIIKEINSKDKTILTIKQSIFLKAGNSTFPLVCGATTAITGHWTSVRATTSSAVYAIATDSMAKQFLEGHSDVFMQSSDPILSQIYFVKNIRSIARLLSQS